MLEIKNLTLKYGETDILNHINLTVKNGEVVVLTGCSGSGKSSLLKIINGIIPEIQSGYINGSISLNQHELLHWNMPKRSGYISTVFQNPKTQFYCVNTTDEMVFAMENRGFEICEINHRLTKYIDQFEITHLLERNLFTLSGGEKQLVALTSVATLENEVLLFDEPSSSLDQDGIQKLVNAIKQLKGMGKIIIIAEHRLYYLRDLLDQLAIIENGDLVTYSKEQITELSDSFLKNKYELRMFQDVSINSINSLHYQKINLLYEGTQEYKQLFSEKNEGLYGENIEIHYGEQKIIQRSFLFKKGINFIVGENGVGKTSLIKRLTGLNRGKGKVYYLGKWIKKPNQIMSLVMQDVNYQIFTDSVWNEISIVSDNEEQKIKILKELDLYSKKEEHPQVLSGGEKQRLMIGLAKASQKPIVILDEPTSGLCKKQMMNIIGYLKEMEMDGKCVIVITHDKELIQNCGGRIFEFIR